MASHVTHSKLKLNKLQKIKSRYKTEVTTEPSREEEIAFDISRSEEFTRIYNRLSGHFNLGVMPKKMYTEEDRNGSGRGDGGKGKGWEKTRKVHSTNSRQIQTKSLTKSIITSSSHHTPFKQTKRSTSDNKILLPEVRANYPEHSHPIKSTKRSKVSDSESLNPLIDKKFPGSSGLVLHVTNLSKVYNTLRKNAKLEAVMAEIEQYIMESNQSDISCLDQLFLNQTTAASCKVFIFLERFLVILIVESLLRKSKSDKVSLRILLRMICDQYVSFLSFLGHKGFPIQAKTVKEMLGLMGSEEEVVKTRKIFYENKEIIEKVSTYLLNNPRLRDYFHQQLPKVSKQSINESFFDILEYYSLSLAQNYSSCPEIVKFLSTSPSPYLHYVPHKQYTLVMDLDETLIHYNEANSSLLVRPYCKKFVSELAEHFEIGVFTCAMPDYADWAINQLKLPISFRLYRHHTVQAGDNFFKDLNRIGRDIERTIIVDNLAENFLLTPKNGIHIKGWIGDKDDIELLMVQEKLLNLVKLAPTDIRQCLPNLLKEPEPQLP